MAQLIHADGTTEDRQPADGQAFQLQELYQMVKGPDQPLGSVSIELLSTRDGRFMVINGEGKMRHLSFPRNDVATALIDFASPEQLQDYVAALEDRGVTVAVLGDLTQQDYVVGTVLVCQPEEVD